VSDSEPQTEGVDASTADIDTVDSAALARILIAANQDAVNAALAATGDIARAIDAVTAAVRGGNRVHYVGAGTSGRLGVLDASELPPTFGVDAALFDAQIAGGDKALRHAVEGAEDDAAAGALAGGRAARGDVIIGISASGGAPFVCSALRIARERGAVTIAIVNSPGAPLAEFADIAIVLATGAEPIAGSTRLKAGTAQKIVLNAISTGAMVQLGKTYGNRMVDLIASNAKLRARAGRLVSEIVGGDIDAEALLTQSGGSAKTAIVMARVGCDRGEAERRLAQAGGRLVAVIGRD
jgi:N-acetylmuramic acid 6-phosphate etherase